MATDSFVGGTSGTDDLRANPIVNPVTNNGTQFDGRAGDDVLRGGRGDDILNGGAGNDQLFGGAGADQFRFDGGTIEGTSDRDLIRDLNFGQGDMLVFNRFGAGTFETAEGIKAFDSGDDAIISSYEGLANAFRAGSVQIFDQSSGNGNIIVRLTNGSQVQDIVITDSSGNGTAESQLEDALGQQLTFAPADPFPI